MTHTTFTDSITIAAPPDAVWHALTDAEASRLWRGADYVTDWQPGGPLVIRRAFGPKTIEDHGSVVEAILHSRLSYRFISSISHLPDLPESYSTIAMALTPATTGTDLSVAHTFPDPPARRAKAAASGLDLSGAKHVEFYWRSALPLLRDLVEGRPNFVLDVARKAATE